MSALFYLLPALLLLGALLLGRYLGERLLLAAARRPRRPVRAARTALRRGRPRLASLPRGSALLAAALAGRAPPHQSSRRDENATHRREIVPSANALTLNFAPEGDF
jgi:hypothetical protein